MTLVKVGEVGDIKENAGREVKVGETRIALFYANGRYYAIEADMSSPGWLPCPRKDRR